MVNVLDVNQKARLRLSQETQAKRNSNAINAITTLVWKRSKRK